MRNCFFFRFALTLRQHCCCSSWGGCRPCSRSCTALCPRWCWYCGLPERRARSSSCGWTERADVGFTRSCLCPVEGRNQQQVLKIQQELETEGRWRASFTTLTCAGRGTCPHSERRSSPNLSGSEFLRTCGKICCQTCTAERSVEKADYYRLLQCLKYWEYTVDTVDFLFSQRYSKNFLSWISNFEMYFHRK